MSAPISHKQYNSVDNYNQICTLSDLQQSVQNDLGDNTYLPDFSLQSTLQENTETETVLSKVFCL